MNVHTPNINTAFSKWNISNNRPISCATMIVPNEFPARTKPFAKPLFLSVFRLMMRTPLWKQNPHPAPIPAILNFNMHMSDIDIALYSLIFLCFKFILLSCTYCKYGIKSIGMAIEQSDADIRNIPSIFV